MKNYKRKIAVLLAVLIALGCGFAASADSTATAPGKPLTGKEYLLAAENTRYELWVNPADGQFYVTDKKLGQTVRSNPTDAETDRLATGYNKMTLQSAFELTYISDKGITDVTNSLVGSVRKNGMKLWATADGVYYEYNVPEVSMTVPVEVKLGEDAFTVSVATDKIIETGEYSLLNISLMPYLGAAQSTDTGYLMLPDGCGALVEFSAGNAVPSDFVYRKAVSGGNVMNVRTGKSSVIQDIRIPAFGIKTEQYALIGIVSEGAALSDIEAYGKGLKCSGSAVHAVFQYHGTSTRTLFDDSWDRKKVTMVAEQPVSTKHFSVRYNLCEQADYVGMAKETAAYFGAEEHKRSKSLGTVVFEIPAAVRRATNILGIPVQKAAAINGYGDVAAIAEQIKAAGIADCQLFYAGAFSGGLFDKIPVSAKMERVLGSARERKDLQKKLKKQGIGLYPMADLARIYRSGNGIYQKLSATRNFIGGNELISGFSPVTTFATTVHPISYTVLKSQKQGKVYQEFSKKLQKNGFSGFVDCGADVLSSDNPRGKAALDAQGFADSRRASVKKVSKTVQQYILQNASAELMAFADEITGAASVSDRMDGFTREIPFYSLVATAFAPVVTTSMNAADDVIGYALKCAEYGMLPSAYLSHNEMSSFAETSANLYYAAEEDAVLKNMKTVTEICGDALEVIAAQPLVSHEKATDGVYCSRYTDDTTIYVNYTANEAVVGTIKVPAKGIAVLNLKSRG